MKRYSKTLEQQNRFYETSDFYGYIVESVNNGNFTQAKELYRELNKECRKDFITNYLFGFFDSQTILEILQTIL